MSINVGAFKNKTKSKEAKLSNILNKEISFSSKFNDKKKERFYNEFASLISSGIDFKRSLEIVKNQYKNKKDRELINDLKEQVIKGKSLYEAMQSKKDFSAFECYSVKIGEETRKLDSILLELQKYFKGKIQMRRQLVSVFTYPSFVLLVTFGVLYFMMNNVVPMFTSVFKQFGSELPPLTKKIVKLSENFSTITLALGLIILVIILFHRVNRRKVYYRNITAKIILKIPFFGRLIKKIYLSRICQFLGLLLASKMPLVVSIELTQKVIQFYPIESSLDKIRDSIMKGGTLAASLKQHSIYENKLVSMVEVAEEINNLDDMFKKLASQYNEEIEHQTKMIGVVLEPLIIMIIGAIVGVIMVAMYSPMFDLSKIIS